MKELAYKNTTSKKHRRRIISITETAVKKGFHTHTQKRFIYFVRRTAPKRETDYTPNFFITKVYDTKKGTEKVLFRIKGVMEVVKDNSRYWIYYCHSLCIDIAKDSNSAVKSAQ